MQELVAEVERWLNLLWIAVEGASLRLEDRRKAVEVAAMLCEIRRTAKGFSSRSQVVLVDAAAGKSYLGLLAAKLVLEPMGLNAKVVAIERDPRRVELSRRAAERLDTTISLEFRQGDIGDEEAWPDQPSIVTALHACGPAADAVITRAIASRARALLLVPCCTSEAVPAAARAHELAEQLAFPRHAPVRRRFIQAAIDAHRTLRLEASGYQTEVVEFVGATVTPHNLLWRSRRVGEPKRMEAARRSLSTFESSRL